MSDALPVRVYHHEGNVALLGCANEFDDLGVNRRLAPGELDHFRLALGSHEVVEHLFDLFERQAESGAGFRKAERASHVAGAIDLDDAEARMLLVVGTQPAIVWAAISNLRSVSERNRPR